jgi:hypothetical protein
MAWHMNYSEAASDRQCLSIFDLMIDVRGLDVINGPHEELEHDLRRDTWGWMERPESSSEACNWSIERMHICLRFRSLLERRGATDMIGVRVRQDNMTNIFRAFAQLLQGLEDLAFTARKTSIDQDAALRIIEQKCVNRTSGDDVKPS